MLPCEHKNISHFWMHTPDIPLSVVSFETEKERTLSLPHILPWQL